VVRALAIGSGCGAPEFAGLYQQLSLLCDRPELGACAGRAFSQPLTRFADAAYFSTVTLSTDRTMLTFVPSANLSTSPA
jgi:hypothetical protein